MGTTKTAVFTEKQNRIAQLSKALGHPARIAIIGLLLKKQNCICGDIVNEMPLSQATISQHLKALKAAGLIKGDIEGRKSCYCINEEVWQEARDVLEKLFSTYVPGNNCC